MRWLARLLVVIVALSMMYDLSRPPSAQISTRIALTGIRVYQATLSPLVGMTGIRCRFKPTCSRYAAAVIARDGVVRGSWLAMRRIARCGPWTPRGTVDEP